MISHNDNVLKKNDIGETSETQGRVFGWGDKERLTRGAHI